MKEVVTGALGGLAMAVGMIVLLIGFHSLGAFFWMLLVGNIHLWWDAVPTMSYQTTVLLTIPLTLASFLRAGFRKVSGKDE